MLDRALLGDDPVLAAALADSDAAGLPTIAVSPQSGKLLKLLATATGARRILEIGTLGGYSTICLARAVGPEGTVVTLEYEPKHAQVARVNLERAGVTDRVQVLVGTALETLPNLTGDPFDFVFIDAEKPGYPAYFDWALENLRLGGIIAAHNAYRKGSVAGLGKDDENSELMRQFNRQVANESRLISTIFPAGDGTLISVKIA